MARRWPLREVSVVTKSLKGSPVVLVGLNNSPGLPCDIDLRGKLTIGELVALMSVARCLIRLDSGALQLALASGLPSLAVFAGVDLSGSLVR